jgi:hypothetical protein
MKLDVPIVFNSITYDDSHEGDPESTRSIIWTLNFTAKGYLFGPVGDIKMIRKATANVYDNTFESNPLREMTLEDGSGDYKYNEMVYQGRAVDEALVTAYVRSWNNTSNTIVVYDSNGTFAVGQILVGAVSGAKYNVASFATNPNQLVNITVEPIPNTANTEAEAFGFSTNITEYV